MKTKRFNKTTTPARTSKAPCVRVSKNGTIIFNSALCELVGLKKGNGVEFLQDAERLKDWYFVVSNAPQAFVLRPNTSQAGLIVSSSSVTKNIFSACGVEVNSVAFFVATQPTIEEGEQFWAILTSSAKKNG